MRPSASSTWLGLAVAATLTASGCSSSSKNDPPPEPKPKPAPAAPAAEDAGADPPPIVIKGSRRSDDAAPAPRSEGSSASEDARQARIAELTRKANADNVTGDWKDFLSPDRTFRVLFPSRPVDQVMNMRLANGSTLPVHTFGSAGKIDTRGFSVTYSDLPTTIDAATTEKVLDGMVQGLVNTMRGTLIETHAVELGPYKGRESRVEARSRKLAGRALGFVAGRRLFAIQAFAPLAEADARDVTRFLDSFKILLEPGQEPPPIQGAGQAPVAPISAGPPPRSSWVGYTSPSGRFTAAFPGKPTTKEDVTTPPGATASLTVYGFNYLDAVPGPRAFSVGYFDLPGVPTQTDHDQVFKSVRDGAVTKLKGHVVDTRLTADGSDETDVIDFDDGSATARQRTVFVGSRVYAVAVITPKDPTNQGDAQYFLDSFKPTGG
jgi:hypothetical protein